LISLIEEEFGLSISPDDVPQLVSFELILHYLQDADRQRLSPGEAE
jgi:acyl carrier protein